MRKMLGVSLTFLMMFTSHAAIPGEGHSAIKTMASILAGINHHPSSTEKEQLKVIVNDNQASTHTRTLAQAMINIDHKVNRADKAKLQKIAGDATASDHERELANILINLSHKASADDKHKLHGMH